MKNIFLLLSISILLFQNVCIAQNNQSKSDNGKQPEIKWYSLNEALELNKKNPKKIFVDVYTDWCGWCKKMETTTFNHPQIIQYMNEKYYAVKLNAEGKDTIVFNNKTFVNPSPNTPKSTHMIAFEFLGNSISYPSFVFINEKNEMINSVKGYMTPQQIDPVLKFFGENVYTMNMWDLFMKCYQTDVK